MRLTIFLIASALFAQDRERPPFDRRGGPGGGFMRMNPFLAALDTDHDGRISNAERVAAPQTLRSVDKNQDGRITQDEMRPVFGPGRGGSERGGQGPDPQEMISMLMRFDQNGDGILTKEEVPERMQGMFARGDRDQDGRLNKDELNALAQSQRGPQGPPDRGRGPGGPPRDPVTLAIDADHDGQISHGEIQNAAAALAVLDKNGDGVLTEEEVAPRFGRGGPGGQGRFGRDPRQMALRMLEEWDNNHDGHLSSEEMPERMRPAFESNDTNHDGKVSLDELMKMMERRGGEGRDRRR